jgi:hypothetical protein
MLVATVLTISLASLAPAPPAHAQFERACVTRQIALGYSDPNVSVEEACDQAFIKDLEATMNEGLDPSAPEFCPPGYFKARAPRVLEIAHHQGEVMAAHPNLKQFGVLVNNWLADNQNKPDAWTQQQAITFVMTSIHYFAPLGTEDKLSAESNQG